MKLREALEKGMEHQVAGRHADAEKIYDSILKKNPDQPDAMHLLGLIRMEQERDDEAVVMMERALELHDSAAHFHHNIAGLYRRTGRLEEAEMRFRKAIELKPDYGEAYQGLGEMVKFKEGDPLLDQVHTQLKREELEDGVRAYFHFAAGKILDDTKQYKQAFEHFAEGNRLCHRKFNSIQFRQLIKDLLYVYSKATVQRLGASAGISSELPVFVVGMPRSGTTLVEQILASHSKVFGAGELNDMKVIIEQARQVSKFKNVYPNCIPGLLAGQYPGLANEYIQRVSKLVKEPNIERIVDKHPLNFQFVGLIYHLFPNARVIHTVRNPLDTCLSCFFQNFTKGQDYSFDLTALAHFYNDYRRLMEHWETVFPGRMLTVKYEDVIDNQEAETRRLIDFVGLDFEEQCLNFHETERRVSTASFLQVRKPIYKSSRQRWVNYREELAQLAQIIGVRVNAPPVTISGNSVKL